MSECIDFAAEGCDWDTNVPCSRPGAGLVGMRVYCARHLAIRQQELERENERNNPKLPGMQDWYRRMAPKRMTDFLWTAGLILLAWLGLSVLAVLGWYLALRPRRAERQ